MFYTRERFTVSTSLSLGPGCPGYVRRLVSSTEPLWWNVAKSVGADKGYGRTLVPLSLSFFPWLF